MLHPLTVQHEQGFLAYKKTHPPEDHHRALGIALLSGLFLMSEVPLYRLTVQLPGVCIPFFGVVTGA